MYRQALWTPWDPEKLFTRCVTRRGAIRLPRSSRGESSRCSRSRRALMPQSIAASVDEPFGRLAR